MSSNHIEVGKQWIANKFHEGAKELEVPLDSLEWRQNPGDMDYLRLSLLYAISGKQHIETFSLSDIEESTATPEVQARIEKRIKNLLQPFSSRPRKIGF